MISPDDTGFNDIGARLKKISEELALYIVTGGGKTARQYIRAARALTVSEEFLDTLGIHATRLNALLLSAFFGEHTEIPCTVEHAAHSPPPVVMGGTTPGHSTDAVGAMLARKLHADRFIVATDVDGIYTEDPKKNPSADMYETLSIRELRSMTSEVWEQAGKSSIIDGVACRIIEEAKISTRVVNGKNLDALENAIYGREFKGTRIEV